MYIILRAKNWICPDSKVKKPHENWYQLFMYIYMTTTQLMISSSLGRSITTQSPCMHGLAALQPLPDWWTICYCHRCAKPRCYLYTLKRSSADATLHHFRLYPSSDLSSSSLLSPPTVAAETAIPDPENWRGPWGDPDCELLCSRGKQRLPTSIIDWWATPGDLLLCSRYFWIWTWHEQINFQTDT
jgi:hypothetical protein